MRVRVTFADSSDPQYIISDMRMPVRAVLPLSNSVLFSRASGDAWEYECQFWGRAMSIERSGAVSSALARGNRFL
jgi:hypothetical protein